MELVHWSVRSTSRRGGCLYGNNYSCYFRMIKGGKEEDFIECDKLIEFLNEKQRDPR